MDGKRFDTISRAIATRSNRRQAIRQAGAGGLLAAAAGAFGVGRLTAAAQDDDDVSDFNICRLEFSAVVAVGPDEDDTYEGEIEFEIGRDGEIEFEIGRDGEIDRGLLRTVDGDEYELVGQATGRAINLRIALGDDRFLSLTGTAQRDIDRCRGEMEGTFGGPRPRDLGTWSASRIRGGNSQTPTASTGIGQSSGNSGSGGNSNQPTVTPTPCPEIDCGVTFVLDPETCECGCPQPYTRCGDSCCFGGAACNADGSCNCPAGTEACNEVCTPSCPSGQYFDANCQCSAKTSCGAGETLCNGQCVSLSCPANQLFDQSVCGCVNRCGSGEDYCGGVCIDVVNDRTNCGFCGNTCPPNMPCIAGSCQCPATTNYIDGECK